jgi:hypothetical protein
LYLQSYLNLSFYFWRLQVGGRAKKIKTKQQPIKIQYEVSQSKPLFDRPTPGSSLPGLEKALGTRLQSFDFVEEESEDKKNKGIL